MLGKQKDGKQSPEGQLTHSATPHSQSFFLNAQTHVSDALLGTLSFPLSMRMAHLGLAVLQRDVQPGLDLPLACLCQVYSSVQAAVTKCYKLGA